MPDEITPDPAEGHSGEEVEAQAPEVLLAGKYKSADELEKAYKSLESKLGQRDDEREALELQLQDLYGRVQEMEAGAQRAAYDPSADPTLIAYEHAMEQGDYKAALAIQAGLMQQIATQSAPKPQQAENPVDPETWAFVADQTAAQEVGVEEWAAYKERVAEEAQHENFEGLSAAAAGKKLARIYKMVKADDVLNTQQSLAEQQAEADRQAKLAAQTMTGASGRPEEPTKDEEAVGRILKAAHQGSYSALLRGDN